MSTTSTPTVLSPAEEWATAVRTAAEKAKEVLPESLTRIDKAVAIVLADGVELLDGGKARVTSQSNDGTKYSIANGECSCHDYEFQAPAGWCKHRLARALYLRAARAIEETTAAMMDVPAESAAAEKINPQVPPQHIVLIQGKWFIRYAGLLQMAHEQGLVSLTTTWTYNDAELSLAHAVAVFADGKRFEECGDATITNVNKKVAVHFRRVALTRASSRCLRNALGVDMVALEELDTGD